MTYYIQPKTIPFKESYNMATGEDVAIFLLGRCPLDYIVIKSDESMDRIITFTDYEYSSIKFTCETA